MRLVLPHPVSANAYWRSYVPKGWKRAIVHLSDEAKAYKEEVGWIAKAAGFKSPTSKPIALKLTLVPRLLDKNGDKTGSIIDLSNCLKVAEDALQGIVYENDRQVQRIEMAYGERAGRGALIVEIDEFVPAPGPLFGDVADQVQAMAASPKVATAQPSGDLPW